MNKYFEEKRQQALENKEAKNYYCFCMYLVVKPENVKLYKEGFKEVHGFEITQGDLERILKW
jgi:hypothetical protein